MSRQPIRFLVLMAVLVLAGLFVVACSGSELQNNNTGLPLISDENQTGNEQAPTPAQSVTTESVSPDPTNHVILPNVNVAPNPEATKAPAVKTELEATNPATVSMASGKPQLVEFFAFW